MCESSETSTIGNRLREERLRLGMNQTEFGRLLGVSKESQINYEAGKRSPDAEYLSKAVGIHVDVTYVLTGVRTIAVAELPAPYQVRKARIVGILDDLDDEGLREVEHRAEAEKRNLYYRQKAQQIDPVESEGRAA